MDGGLILSRPGFDRADEETKHTPRMRLIESDHSASGRSDAVVWLHSQGGLLNRMVQPLQRSERFATPAASLELTVQTMASQRGMERFKDAYPLRKMRIRPSNDGELKQMSPDDGMLDLECVSLDQLIQIKIVENPPTSVDDAREGRFLWVVRSSDAPTALEHCAWGQHLETAKIKHSNLTGGLPAHSGGELWVVQRKGVLVNANSGRYGATTPEELAAFVEALRSLGFWVASMGFDLDSPKRPNTIQVGPVDWQAPYE